MLPNQILGISYQGGNDLLVRVYARTLADGCVLDWNEMSFNECNRILSTPVTKCNDEGKKQGGYVSNKCIKWVTDPWLRRNYKPGCMPDPEAEVAVGACLEWHTNKEELEVDTGKDTGSCSG
jgi:hypothetical protein